MFGDRPWTKDEIDILIHDIKNGSSAAITAQKIGRTRNAVLGKTSRLRLSRKRVHVTNSTPATRLSYKPFPNGCLWPIENGWCGCPTVHKSYCQEHAALVYSNRQLDIDTVAILALASQAVGSAPVLEIPVAY